MIPPWPGIKDSKSFTLYARLIALAKKPPKGATNEAKAPKHKPYKYKIAISLTY